MRGESSFLTGLSIPGTLPGRLTAERPALRVAFASTCGPQKFRHVYPGARKYS
jgi:hypothetical protein